MDIKLKNKKTSIFIISFLTVICTSLLSCNSAKDLENTIFYKTAHPREYVFDIYDIEEYPKMRREKDSKKLIYSVDFSEYVKYDLPQAGDKLTLKYKGSLNKDISGPINVSLEGQPASYVFVSNLNKGDSFENQVSFTLDHNISEVKFNLKYDNPKTFFSIILQLEKAADTTNTKTEKKELEKAIKRGQQIVEISTLQNTIPAEQEQEIEQEKKPELQTEEEIVQEEIKAPQNNSANIPNMEEKSSAPSYTIPIVKKPRDIKDIPYHKLSHPRLYYFDINKIDQKPKLKKVKGSEKLAYSVDFTKLAKEDMPQAGDKIIFIYKGAPDKDIPGNVYASLETPSSQKVIFSTDLKKDEKFRNRISFVLDENINEIKLNIEYDNPNKYSKAFFTMEHAIFSTDTGEELKEYKKALRQGRQIIEWTNEIVDDYKDITSEEQNSEEEITEETNIETTSPVIETLPETVPLSEQEEENIPLVEEPYEELPEEETKETEPLKDFGNIEEEPPAPIFEKTPEELMLLEERKKLEEQQRQLREEQAKLEAEKAKFAAEEKARQEAEAARLAKEAEEKAKQLEAARIEAERQKQQEMLEKTIETVTSTNVKRYEKEYLNDYAVSGYTFDIEQEEQKDKKLFEDPNQANDHGTTLLMDAAKEGNDWKIKTLLTSGADVNKKDKDGWTALMYAVRYNGNMSCVTLLIEAGADVKAVNKYGMSALVIASNYNSNPEILKKLLSYYSPNEKDVLKSFVQVLTENQDDEYMQIIKVNMFLDMSVPLNSLYNGKTPLMYAAESGNSTKVIKLLMENSNKSIRSREGKTAFDYAKENPKLKHDDIYWSLNNK